jgi:hypothetical protein
LSFTHTRIGGSRLRRFTEPQANCQTWYPQTHTGPVSQASHRTSWTQNGKAVEPTKNLQVAAELDEIDVAEDHTSPRLATDETRSFRGPCLAAARGTIPRTKNPFTRSSRTPRRGAAAARDGRRRGAQPDVGDGAGLLPARRALTGPGMAGRRPFPNRHCDETARLTTR